jgi:hypothetical protein
MLESGLIMHYFGKQSEWYTEKESGVNGVLYRKVELIVYCLGKWSERCTVKESGVNGVLLTKVE